MLGQVLVDTKQLQDYRSAIGDQAIDEIMELARPLRGAHVVHVNATAFGGGVAEILMSLVPLMCDVGLEAEWQVIAGDQNFFNVTKACHNGLQGMHIPFTKEMKEIWMRYNEENARRFEGRYDFAVIHDPQPAGLLAYGQRELSPYWLWRCHIDTSQPNPEYWNFFAPFLQQYDKAIFSRKEYAGAFWPEDRLWIIPPSIDPLSPKNLQMPEEEARAIVARFGIDPSRPLITQVSRFDPWKDPLGVIDAYRLVKQEHPEVQLALVGSMATDDPEGWYYLDKTSRHAGEDQDIFILHNFHGVGAQEVSAFQQTSDIIVQKSLREGFGLVVAEAMWKGKPVIGGNVGGIPLQVIDAETGFLVHSVEECAEKILLLLDNPGLSQEMGTRAREHVRQHFLITRHLLDYLLLFRSAPFEPYENSRPTPLQSASQEA